MQKNGFLSSTQSIDLGKTMNKKQVIQRIGKNKWAEFERFMAGQTVGLNKDGTTDYYEWDVENFLRKPKNRFSD